MSSEEADNPVYQLKLKFPKIPPSTLEVLLKSNENNLEQAIEFTNSLLRYSSKVSDVLTKDTIVLSGTGTNKNPNKDNPVRIQFRRKLRTLLKEGRKLLDQFLLDESLVKYSECEDHYLRTTERYEDAGTSYFFEKGEKSEFEMELYTGFVFLHKLIQPIQFKFILKYLLKIERLFQERREYTRERTEICNSIGYYFKQFQKYNQSLKYYHRSLKIAKEIDFEKGQSKTLNNLGTIYYELRKYNESLKFLQKSYELRVSTNDRIGQGITLFNIASIYHFGMSEFSKAILFYQKAEKVFSILNQTHQLLITVKNKIKCIEEIILSESSNNSNFNKDSDALSTGRSSHVLSDSLFRNLEISSTATNEKNEMDKMDETERESQLYEILLDELRKNFLYQRNVLTELKRVRENASANGNEEEIEKRIAQLNEDLSKVLRNLRDVSSSNRIHRIHVLQDVSDEEEEEGEEEEEEELNEKKSVKPKNERMTYEESKDVFSSMIYDFSSTFPLQSFQLIEFLRKDNKTFEIFYPISIQFIYFYIHKHKQNKLSKKSQNSLFIFYFNQFSQSHQELPNLVYFKKINLQSSETDDKIILDPSHPKSHQFYKSLVPHELIKLIETSQSGGKSRRIFVFLDKEMYKVNFQSILYDLHSANSPNPIHIIHKFEVVVPMDNSLYYLKNNLHLFKISRIAESSSQLGMGNMTFDVRKRKRQDFLVIMSFDKLSSKESAKEKNHKLVLDLISVTKKESVYCFDFGHGEIIQCSRFINFCNDSYGASRKYTIIFDFSNKKSKDDRNDVKVKTAHINFSNFFEEREEMLFSQCRSCKMMIFVFCEDDFNDFFKNGNDVLKKLCSFGIGKVIVICVKYPGEMKRLKRLEGFGIPQYLKEKFLVKFLGMFEMKAREVDVNKIFRKVVLDMAEGIRSNTLKSLFVSSVYLFG